MKKRKPNAQMKRINDSRSDRKRDEIEELFPPNYEFLISDFYSGCPYTLINLMTPSRKRDIVQWRQILMLFYYMNGMNLEEIERETGRDHATVLYGIRCVKTAMEGFDKTIKSKIDQILDNLGGNLLATKEAGINEMISLTYLESEMLKKFPTLVGAKASFSVVNG